MPSPSSPPVDWYEAAQEVVQQGDLLFDFPMRIPVLNAESNEWEIAEQALDAIVLTQSCDILKKSHEWIQIGAVYSWQEACRTMSHVKKAEYQQSLKQGTSIADFLLPPVDPSASDGFQLVHFRDVFTVHKSWLGNARSRVSLRTPYREHLAQAYARFMMRVGLPNGLQGCDLY